MQQNSAIRTYAVSLAGSQSHTTRERWPPLLLRMGWSSFSSNCYLWAPCFFLGVSHILSFSVEYLTC